MSFLGCLFHILPAHRISNLFGKVIREIISVRCPKDNLVLLFNLEKRIYKLTNDEACRYENGIHPKHRHIKYHDFFCNRISVGEKVVDIGSGNGALAYDLAERGAFVTGIEISKEKHREANIRFAHPRINYVHGNAIKELPNKRFDTVVLSNVLEHIDDRVGFLNIIQSKLEPGKWLIRVPLYERDWRVPLMEELGIDYRLDGTHFIEYTQDNFKLELEQAGLKAVHIQIQWGEIWCEVRPVLDTDERRS